MTEVETFMPITTRRSRTMAAGRLARLGLAGALLGLLAACADTPSRNAATDARGYQARARGDYKPPGPPHDPWGPYIQEAAKRFDVPERWIREVMRAESGGRLISNNGDLVTSGAGAMGLMQVMPSTYEELRERHEGLGPDPYEPRSNILAGTAYIREMYEIYGTPAFLAAYNAGPRRLDDYLAGARGLPNETRSYVAKIGPAIAGHYPETRSHAEQYAMNSIPTRIPAGNRRNGAEVLLAEYRGTTPAAGGTAFAAAPRGLGGGSAEFGGGVSFGNTGGPRAPVEVAELPDAHPAAPRVAVARAEPLAAPPAPPPAATSEPRGGGFRLISTAHATPVARGAEPAGAQTGRWAIQVGAFKNPQLARSAADAAHRHASDALGGARQQISGVKQGKTTLYRARLIGLSQDAAQRACQRLSRNRSTCIVLSPDAQS